MVEPAKNSIWNYLIPLWQLEQVSSTFGRRGVEVSLTRGHTIRQTKVCQKIIFNSARLCYSIQEAMKNLRSQISSSMSFWPYWYEISCNYGFQIRR